MHDYFENEKAPYFLRNLAGLHDEDKLRVVVERLKKDMCQRSLTTPFAKKHIKKFLFVKQILQGYIQERKQEVSGLG